MSTVSSIHTQLASIVDVLAKAAVAEICELVDNGYAILHLEISRSHKENKALKKKLQMMELRIARRSDDRIARANSANSCSDRVQICNELRQNKPRKDEYYPSNVWGNRECRAPDEDGTTLSSTRDQSADKKRVRPESRLVKMEQLEVDFETSEQRGGVNINEQKIVESDGGEKAPIADAQTEPAIGTEELTEQHSTRKTVWEDSTLGTVLKAEPDNENASLQDAEGRLSNLGNKYALYERPGHLETFFTQSTIQTETEGPTCSYTVETNLESMSVHSELQFACTAEKGLERGLSTSDSLDMKPEVETIDILDPVSNKLDVDMSSSWTKEAASGVVLKQHRYYKENGKRGALQHEDVLNVCPSESHLLIRENTVNTEVPNMIGYAPGKEGLTTSRSVTASHRPGAREKRFLCSHCWKSFTCLRNLETHQRVHTGEKPFGCAQCGKRFSQSAYLRKHCSVHTGKKPFRCTKCGKCFSDSSNFKRHQYVHTGERPFRCMQCGKRFSFLGNLKRHQSIHLGKKASGHTPWDEFTHFKSH
ncbi:zinc finger protein 239-like [Anguilla rostrata]